MGLEAIASRLEATAPRLEAIAIGTSNRRWLLFKYAIIPFKISLTDLAVYNSGNSFI